MCLGCHALPQMCVESDPDAIEVSFNGRTLEACAQDRRSPAGLAAMAGRTALTIPAGEQGSSGETHGYLSLKCGPKALTSSVIVHFGSLCDANITQVVNFTMACIRPCPPLAWSLPTSAARSLLINSNYMSKHPDGKVRAMPVCMCMCRAPCLPAATPL